MAPCAAAITRSLALWNGLIHDLEIASAITICSHPQLYTEFGMALERKGCNVAINSESTAFILVPTSIRSEVPIEHFTAERCAGTCWPRRRTAVAGPRTPASGAPLAVMRQRTAVKCVSLALTSQHSRSEKQDIARPPCAGGAAARGDCTSLC
eukprot:827578-Prymnesium_polylepis.2